MRSENIRLGAAASRRSRLIF